MRRCRTLNDENVFTVRAIFRAAICATPVSRVAGNFPGFYRVFASAPKLPATCRQPASCQLKSTFETMSDS